MSVELSRPARKPGRPKKVKPLRDVAAKPVRTCPFVENGEKCGAYISHHEKFCINHSVPAATPAEMVEKQVLGEEAAARLREELRVNETTRDMAAKAADPQPVSQEAEVMARVLEMAREQGKAPKAAPAPKPRPAKAESPDEVAHRMVVEMVAKQKAEMEERASRRRGQGPAEAYATGRAAMSISTHFPELPDMSAMVDSEGKSLVPPGYTGRWIRTKDSSGKPSNRRLNEFRAMLGAVDVKDENGEPLEGDLGKAVMFTNEARARWILHKSDPGAFDVAARQAEMAYESADTINRQIGRSAVQVLPREDHGVTDLI